MLKLYDGMLDLLDRLTEAGVKLGLVTSKSRPTTQMAFDLTGIEHYFDATVCCDEAPGQQAHRGAHPLLLERTSDIGSGKTRPTSATAPPTSRRRTRPG